VNYSGKSRKVFLIERNQFAIVRERNGCVNRVRTAQSMLSRKLHGMPGNRVI
jgi:hypothetical protein